MPEVSNRVRYCSYLLAVVAATTGLFGIVYMFSSQPMPYHLAYVGMSFEEIRAFNPNLASFAATIINYLGAFHVSSGILLVGIALVPFQRLERWAWLTLVPSMSVVVTSSVLNSFRSNAPVKWVILALALFSLTAMLVPVKDFFGNR